jgi:hypothetical protein
MTRRLETAVYLALLAGLSLLVAAEGRRRAELERRVPVAPERAPARVACAPGEV